MTTLPPQPPSNVPPPPGAPAQAVPAQAVPTMAYMPPPMPHAPAPTAKSKTPLIVGIVAGVVAIGGLVGFLVSRGSGGGEAVAVADIGTPDGPQPAFDIGSPPVAPAVPGAGDVPTQVTLPSPEVSAPVSSAVAPPPTAAPTDSAPTAPPPTAPPPTTAAPGGGASTGSVEYVDMAAGVRVPAPPGFTVDLQNPSFLWMYNDIGELTVAVYQQLSTSGAAVDYYITSTLSGYLTDLEYTNPQPSEVDSPRLIETVVVGYRGTFVSQQSGSIPVEGRFFVNVRVDGVIIVQDVTWYGNTPDLAVPAQNLPDAVLFLSNFVYG